MVTEKRRRDMADTNNYYARMYYTHDGARVLTKRKTNQVKKIGEDETRNEKKSEVEHRILSFLFWKSELEC